jgi:hypothetical protein
MLSIALVGNFRVVEVIAPSNNSMDVRAKQRLCYQRALLPLACRWRFRPTSSQPFDSFFDAKICSLIESVMTKN